MMHFLAKGSEGEVWHLPSRRQVIKHVREPNLRNLLRGKELSRRYEQWHFLHQNGFAAPNVIRRRGERLWLISPHVTGISFLKFLDSNASSHAKLAAFISGVRQLGYLHSLGYLHGDISPSNLIVSNQNHAEWIDWTCADRVGKIFFRATPGYSAPESLGAGVYSLPSEIYSLGAVLAISLHKINLQPSQMKSLERIAAKAQHVLPGRRWSSVFILLNELEAVL